MSGISLKELDAQFSELLPEREALGCISHISFHRHHHHCPPRPCPPPLHHHCPPPPLPYHPKTWLPFAPKP